MSLFFFLLFFFLILLIFLLSENIKKIKGKANYLFFIIIYQLKCLLTILLIIKSITINKLPHLLIEVKQVFYIKVLFYKNAFICFLFVFFLYIFYFSCSLIFLSLNI